MKSSEDLDAVCCPKFDPVPWDDQIFDWKEKPFIKSCVRTFFYMPVDFGRTMKRLSEMITKAQASISDNLCLSDHTSRWNMDVYLAVDRQIPGAENTTLSGKFYGKVYEGPFRDTGKWCTDYEKQAKEKGFSIKRWFMWYTTCPKCAKKYGKNYVVVMDQVE